MPQVHVCGTRRGALHTLDTARARPSRGNVHPEARKLLPWRSGLDRVCQRQAWVQSRPAEGRAVSTPKGGTRRTMSPKTMSPFSLPECGVFPASLTGLSRLGFSGSQSCNLHSTVESTWHYRTKFVGSHGRCPSMYCFTSLYVHTGSDSA
jgi:hypothetical protein